MSEARIIGARGVEVSESPGDAAGPIVCAAHPAEPMAAASAELLASLTGRRALAVNPAGVGGAGPAGGGDLLDEVVDDLEAVRAAFGGRPFVFWGMSGGAYVGQRYAQRHPEAFAALILSSAGACFSEVVGDPACVLSPRHPAWAAALAAGDASDGGWRAVPGAGWAFGAPPRLVVPMEPPPRLAAVLAALLAFDARPALGEVRVPTLVLCGRADPLVPFAHAEALAKAIPGTALVGLEGAGHALLTEQPDACGAAVRAFLAERLG